MNKKTLLLIVIGGLGALAFGVYFNLKKQLELALNYCYKIKSFKFNSLTKNNIDITIGLLLRNQSVFSVELENYFFNIYINGRFIASVQSNKKQLIQAEGVSPLVINLAFNPSTKFSTEEVAKLLIYGLVDRDKFKIKLDGYVSVNHAGIIKAKELPVELDYTLKELMTDDGQAETCKVE